MIQLLDAQASTNAAPALLTDGFALWQGEEPGDRFSGIAKGTDEALISLETDEGTGTVTVTPRLWLMTSRGIWSPASNGATFSVQGVLNGGVALVETATDYIAHAEIIFGLRHYARVYLQVAAISAATSVSAWLD